MRAPNPITPSIIPNVKAVPLKISFANTGVNVLNGKTNKPIIPAKMIIELTTGVIFMYAKASKNSFFQVLICFGSLF